MLLLFGFFLRGLSCKMQEILEQPSIHFLLLVRGRLESITASLVEGGVTGVSSLLGLTYRDKQQSTFTFTFRPTCNLESPINLTPSLHVFGMGEEAGEPGENPRTGRTCKLCKETPWTGIESKIYSLWGDSVNCCTTRAPHVVTIKSPLFSH